MLLSMCRSEGPTLDVTRFEHHQYSQFRMEGWGDRWRCIDTVIPTNDWFMTLRGSGSPKHARFCPFKKLQLREDIGEAGGPNVCLSAVNVDPLWPSDVVQMRMTYPAQLYKIWYSDEKPFVSSGIVVVIDPSMENGQKFLALASKESMNSGAGIPCGGASKRFYVQGGIPDLLPNV
ncbi:hypothetical protein BDM02DRAFT_3117504, partial [Thelephora ganbajun]